MKILLAVVSIFFLTSCTAEFEAAADAAAGSAKRLSDNRIEASEWSLCKAQSAGAIIRRYGTSKEAWGAYITLCWKRSLPGADNVPPLNRDDPT